MNSRKHFTSSKRKQRCGRPSGLDHQATGYFAIKDICLSHEIFMRIILALTGLGACTCTFFTAQLHPRSNPYFSLFLYHGDLIPGWIQPVHYSPSPDRHASIRVNQRRRTPSHNPEHNSIAHEGHSEWRLGGSSELKPDSIDHVPLIHFRDVAEL